MRPAWSSSGTRIDAVAASNALNAYVLHTRRYGDSSLIADLYSREQGRLAAVAKGALKAKGERVQPFQAYAIAVSGRGEVLTLTGVEASDSPLTLQGRKLFCGLYLNELLLKLTARQDPCDGLFDDYAAALGSLHKDAAIEPTLRRFEVRLLRHLGLGLILDRDVNGQSIVSDRRYTYDIHHGAAPVSTGDNAVSGATLLALRDDLVFDDSGLRESRQLMRRVLHHHLDGRPLRSRELFR